MKVSEARVRFQESSGRLHAVEVTRSNSRPIISALHRTLFAVGVVITSYRVQATTGGLHERMELASMSGEALTDHQSEQVRAVTIPLAWDGATDNSS